MTSQKGSTLIWVMTVILIILIVFTAALVFVNTRLNITVAEHQEQQAYYTALSSLDTVSDWIAGSYKDGASQTYRGEVEDILTAAETSGGVTYSLGGLATDLGTCDINIVYMDPGVNTTLKLTATATSAGVTESLSRIMKKGEGQIPSDWFPVSDFTLDSYQQRVAELNALNQDSNPVLEGQYYDVGTYWRDDSHDEALIAPLVASVTNREAKYDSWYTYTAGVPRYYNTDALINLVWGANNSTTLTPGKALPNNYYESTRTFVVPENGRITFNPLRHNNNSSNDNANKANSANTEISVIAIRGSANRDVKLRLGGGLRSGETSPKYNSVICLDFVDQNTPGNGGTIANDYVDYYPNNWNLPMTMTTNSSGQYTNATPVYSMDASGHATNSYMVHEWFPQKWNSATIFTQDIPAGTANKTVIDDGIRARLVFMPYHFLYPNGDTDRYYDYWGWGSYVANPNYGQSAGDAYKVTGQWSDTAGKNKRGMPSLPVYYGNDFELYLTDNIGTTAAEKASSTYRGNLAWIQQGISILGEDDKHSTIYSTRGIDIGGMANRTASWTTFEGINTNIDCFIDDDDPATVSNAYSQQWMWDSLFYDTDIILVTPGGISTPRESTFRRGMTFRDSLDPKSTSNSASAQTFWRKYYSTFHPQTKIIGGRVYVGAGQTLSIQGGTQIYYSPDGNYAKPGTNASAVVKGNYTGSNSNTGNFAAVNPGTHNSQDIATGYYTMECAPEDITVAAGGKLVIEASDNVNIKTDIYVDGGALVIQANAKIMGNIYVYNGGTLEVQGSFTLLSPKSGDPVALAEDIAKDGIHIYGDQAVGKVPNVISAGKLILPTTGPGLIVISGSSNKVHLLGDFSTLVVNQSGNPFISTGDVDAIKQRLLCNDIEESSGMCKHFGYLGGGWVSGEYVRE